MDKKTLLVRTYPCERRRGGGVFTEGREVPTGTDFLRESAAALGSRVPPVDSGRKSLLESLVNDSGKTSGEHRICALWHL